MIKECIAYEELFAAWLEGNLTTAQKIALQNHVEECASCHKEILEMKHHWDHVAGLSFSSPGDRLSKPAKINSSQWSRLFQFVKSAILPLSSRRNRGNGG